MPDTEGTHPPATAFPHAFATLGRPALQRRSGLHVAVVGFAASVALFAGVLLQRGVDAWIYGPFPEGVVTCAGTFEKLCLALLLLFNPQLFAFIVASLALPSAQLPASVANALFLSLFPAWWGLLAWLTRSRS